LREEGSGRTAGRATTDDGNIINLAAHEFLKVAKLTIVTKARFLSMYAISQSIFILAVHISRGLMDKCPAAFELELGAALDQANASISTNHSPPSLCIRSSLSIHLSKHVRKCRTRPRGARRDCDLRLRPTYKDCPSAASSRNYA